VRTDPYFLFKALADLIAGVSFLASLEGAPDELFRADHRSIFFLNALNLPTKPIVRQFRAMRALVNRNTAVRRIPFVGLRSIARQIAVCIVD
jgi:hypothetical protein